MERRRCTLLLLSTALVVMLALSACMPESFVDWRVLNQAGIDALRDRPV
jgi:hypothetical protein